MTRSERIRWLWGGLSILLAIAAAHIIQYWWYSEAMLERWSPVQKAYQTYSQALSKTPFTCDYEVKGEFTYYRRPDDISKWNRALVDKLDTFSRNAFISGRAEMMYRVMDFGSGLTRAFAELRLRENDAQRHVAWWIEPFAKRCADASKENIADVEKEAGAEVAAHLKELKRHWTGMEQALAAYQPNRKWVAIIAWFFILFELGGLVCLFWLTRDYYRNKKAKASGGTPSG